MTLTVTPVYSALLAVLILALAYRITLLRRREKIPLGDGDNAELRKAIAAHQHTLENVPLTLLLMLLLELNGWPAWVLHTAGVVLVISRLVHTYGQSRRTALSFGRYWGTVLNWSLITVLALLNIVAVYR